MEINYSKYLELTSTERLNYFMNTLSPTNRTAEYYINWKKVMSNTEKYEIELNTLNYLIGKNNIYEETFRLFSKQPSLIKAIPSLIACRDKAIDVLSVGENHNYSFNYLNFYDIDERNIKKYVDFCEDSGLLFFLSYIANRSLVDYVYGVEAGLDSNARKNRSGFIMEKILEQNVTSVCKKLNLEHYPQASASFIKRTWNIEIPVNKSVRRFDEAVFAPETNRIWIIEANYYGGGGSKLKAVAGEFIMLNKLLETSKDDVSFVWVTDGQGWLSAQLPLSEAFEQIDNIFNLEMLANGYLFDLFA